MATQARTPCVWPLLLRPVWICFEACNAPECVSSRFLVSICRSIAVVRAFNPRKVTEVWAKARSADRASTTRNAVEKTLVGWEALACIRTQNSIASLDLLQCRDNETGSQALSHDSTKLKTFPSRDCTAPALSGCKGWNAIMSGRSSVQSIQSKWYVLINTYGIQFDAQHE